MKIINIFLKHKKALSNIVATMLMIVLVVSLMAVVYSLTTKFTKDKIAKSKACGIDLIGKISINSEYVCYDGANVIFSINRGDIEMDELLVSISSETNSKNFEINSTVATNGLLPCLEGGATILPQKKAGQTYKIPFSETPTRIQIEPTINNKKCEVTDSLNNIVSCTQISNPCA